MGRKKENLVAEAVEALKNHEYKQLAAWGEGGSEVWECSRPGSSVYAFTICITRMGIAVVGDIDTLVFQVGSSYGMKFLAGNDVDYYIQSKLEHSCRSKQLDREELQRYVIQQVMAHLFGEISEEDQENVETVLGHKLPEMAFDSHQAAELPDDCKELLRALQAKIDDLEQLYDDQERPHPVWVRDGHVSECLDLVEDAYHMSDTNEAYHRLREFDAFDLDLCDCSIEEPSDNLLVRLYMVNEAAKKIMEIKASLAAAESAPEEVPAELASVVDLP